MQFLHDHQYLPLIGLVVGVVLRFRLFGLQDPGVAVRRARRAALRKGAPEAFEGEAGALRGERLDFVGFLYRIGGTVLVLLSLYALFGVRG